MYNILYERYIVWFIIVYLELRSTKATQFPLSLNSFLILTYYAIFIFLTGYIILSTSKIFIIRLKGIFWFQNSYFGCHGDYNDWRGSVRSPVSIESKITLDPFLPLCGTKLFSSWFLLCWGPVVMNFILESRSQQF